MRNNWFYEQAVRSLATHLHHVKVTSVLTAVLSATLKGTQRFRCA